MPLLKPLPLDWSPEAEDKLRKYVDDNIRALKDGHQDLFEQQLPRWRKAYKGLPEREQRDFPWKNASNLVVQLTGMFVDMLTARIMSAVHEVAPLYTVGLSGEWEPTEKGEEQRAILEEFLCLMGVERDELDLYRVEYQVFNDAAKYGMAVCKHPQELVIEAQIMGQGDGKTQFEEMTRFMGPKPEKIPYDAFLIPQNATNIRSPFKAHIKTLSKYQLEERRFVGAYNITDDEWEKLLQSPDRFGADTQTKDDEEGSAKTEDAAVNAEWDIYECWFPYIHEGHNFRLIYTYHYQSKKVLRAVYNFYPDNDEPFEMARLGYEGDTIRGRGFCDMLADYQEEFSTIHNQDNDAGTLANTSIYRIDPNSRLDSMFSIYPSAAVVARKDEFEVYQMGRSNTMDSINRQKFLMELAQQRAGVAPPSSGMGGGIMNPRKNIYSAMGTMAVMQDSNRRTNINVADMRYFHVNLGRKIARQYAYFGIDERARLFGKKAPLLLKALNNLLDKRIGLPIRSSSASLNKEVEKQNDILLVNIVRQHYQWVGSILATLPQAPKHVQDYIVATVGGGNMLMRQIMRNFGHDDVTRYIPDAAVLEQLQDQINKQKEQLNGGAGQENTPDTTGRVSQTGDSQQSENVGVLQDPLQAQGANAGMVPGASNGPVQ